MFTRNPWTEEDLRSSITSTYVLQTAHQIQRSPSSLWTMRFKYKKFLETGVLDGTTAVYIKELFEKFKQEGLTVKRRELGEKFHRVEQLQTPTEEVVAPERDPYTELDILIDDFKVRLAEIVSQIAEQTYAERLRSEMLSLQTRKAGRPVRSYTKKSAGDILRMRIGVIGRTI